MNIRKSKGFTIVEVLVAMIILAIGVLGLGILQVSSIQNTRGGQMRSQASILAYDIVDSMRANLIAVAAGDYDVTAARQVRDDTMCYGAASDCSEQEMAVADIDRWRKAVRIGLLPLGFGTVTTTDIGDTMLVNVTVGWTDPNSVEEFEELTITTELSK